MRADIAKKVSFFALGFRYVQPDLRATGRADLPRRALRFIWHAFLLLVVIAVYFPALAQQKERPEYELKAGWLYHILNSTDWPAESFANKNAPVLVVGVLGKDPFGNYIDSITNRMAGGTNRMTGGKPIMLKRYSSVQEVQNCHILFISSSENSTLAEIFDHLKNSTVVTVGETAEFTRFGGMINLSFSERYAFEFSKKAYKKSGLRIDSRFLAQYGKSVP